MSEAVEINPDESDIDIGSKDDSLSALIDQQLPETSASDDNAAEATAVDDHAGLCHFFVVSL